MGDYSGYGISDFLIQNTSGAVDTGMVQDGATHFTQVSGLGSEWSFHG